MHAKHVAYIQANSGLQFVCGRKGHCQGSHHRSFDNAGVSRPKEFSMMSQPGCPVLMFLHCAQITGVPTFLVNKFTEDVPLTIHDVRKVVMAKLSHACQSKRPDGACQ